jgi:hypothetical protein
MSDIPGKKRIELNEEVANVRLRASRTGGVNLSTAPAKGITLNTTHGARVSKTYKGLTLGFQNFNSVVRGRWSVGSNNINLSKSGLSLSNKNALGTFNFTRPKSSSATLAGIQLRGSTGAIIAFAGMVISLISAAAVVLIVLVPYLLLSLAWVAHTLWSGALVIGSLLIFLVVDVPKQLLQQRKSRDSIPD